MWPLDILNIIVSYVSAFELIAYNRQIKPFRKQLEKLEKEVILASRYDLFISYIHNSRSNYSVEIATLDELCRSGIDIKPEFDRWKDVFTRRYNSEQYCSELFKSAMKFLRTKNAFTVSNNIPHIIYACEFIRNNRMSIEDIMKTELFNYLRRRATGMENIRYVILNFPYTNYSKEEIIQFANAMHLSADERCHMYTASDIVELYEISEKCRDLFDDILRLGSIKIMQRYLTAEMIDCSKLRLKYINYPHIKQVLEYVILIKSDDIKDNYDFHMTSLVMHIGDMNLYKLMDENKIQINARIYGDCVVSYDVILYLMSIGMKIYIRLSGLRLSRVVICTAVPRQIIPEEEVDPFMLAYSIYNSDMALFERYITEITDENYQLFQKSFKKSLIDFCKRFRS